MAAALAAQKVADRRPALQAPARLRVGANANASRPAGAQVLRLRTGHSVALRSRPAGSVAATVGAHTDFGSPTELPVAARRGQWLGVISSSLPNGRLGWVNERLRSFDRTRVRMELVVRLSRRRLELHRGGRMLRRVPVTVGRAQNATPRGRFSVTDKLAGSRFGPYYGCCVLALSGHQPNLPPGWRGGDRLAIHGTDAPDTIGTASSAGCLRARDGDMRYLMPRIPLGTPVVVVG